MNRHLQRPQLATILTIASWLAAAAIVISGVLALVAYGQGERTRADGLQTVVDNLRTRLSDKDDDLKALLDRYSSLYDDCEDAEGCESTQPAPEVIERVLPGPQGDPGPAPSSAEINDAIVSYCILHDECRGPVGAAGASGAAGQPGAAGSSGSAGVDGQQGPQGVQGEPGVPGASGADGQPPSSWTYSDALGFTHTCTRAEPFDATAPTYTCN